MGLTLSFLSLLGAIPALADLPDWGAPTTDKAVIRARDNRYVFPKIYGGIKTLDAWKAAATRAILKGDVPALDYLLKLAKDRKIPIDLRAALDGEGNSPLHLAVNVDNAAIIRWLLKQGFDPNASNDRGDTPLLAAVRKPSARAAQALLADPRVDLERIDREGNSALLVAILRQDEALALQIARKVKPESLHATQLLGSPLRNAGLANDLPLAFQVSCLGTPKDPVCSYSKERFAAIIKAGGPRMMRDLLSKAKLQFSEAELREYFDQTMELGYFEAFSELLMKYPKMLGWSSNDGDRLQHRAAKYASVPGLRALRRAGADFTVRNRSTQTPLDVAHAMRRQEKSRTVDPYGETIKYLEKVKGETEPDVIAKLIPEGDISLWKIYDLIKQGHGPQVLRELGREQLNQWALPPDHLGLFHLAVLDGSADGLKALLAIGLDPEVTIDAANLTAGNLAHLIKSPLAGSFPPGREPEDDQILLRYQDEDTLVRLARLGQFAGRDGAFRRSLLSLGARRNSVALIEAAYSRGNKPFELGDGVAYASCGPTSAKAIEAYVKHPLFRGSPKLRASPDEAGADLRECGGMQVYLHQSKRCGDCPVSPRLVEKLLKMGVRPAEEEQGRELMRHAVQLNDLGLVRALMEAGVELKNPFRLLFAKGVDPDRPGAKEFAEFLARRGIRLDMRQFSDIEIDYDDSSDWNGRAGLDAMIRMDVKQVNPSLQVNLLRNGNERDASWLLNRYGQVRKESRLKRDCAEARAQAPAELLLARESAERLFEILWQDLQAAWERISRREPQSYRALLSILDPRNLDPKYFSESKYDGRVPKVNASFPKRDWRGPRHEDSGGTQGTHTPLCGEFLWMDTISNRESRKIHILRWACLGALEAGSDYVQYDVREAFGAFKKGSSKPLSGGEVAKFLAKDPSQLDLGLQVAISDPEGRFLARVRMELVPPDPAQQKEARKREFLREMGVDRAEGYLAKQHPHCVTGTSKRGVSNRASKAAGSAGEAATGSSGAVPGAAPAK